MLRTLHFSRANQNQRMTLVNRISESVLLGFVFYLALHFSYPYIISAMHNTACAVLNNLNVDYSMKFSSCLWTAIETINIGAPQNDDSFTSLILLISFLFVIVTPRLNLFIPLKMWIILTAILMLISSLVFLIMPTAFPYTLGDFTQSYLSTELLIWLSIPLFFGFSLALLSTSLTSKFLLTTFSFLASIALGITRYALFVLVLVKGSYLFMPVLFFIFGPLLDIYLLVTIYSFYISNYSIKTNKRITT